MPPHQARVLVDTNAFQAAHRYGCWAALHKSFRLETAEHCIEEALRPNRKGKRLVDRPRDDLTEEILAHAVTDSQRAVLLHALQGRVDLDDGERDLLSIALTIKTDVWWLCGPDKATVFCSRSNANTSAYPAAWPGSATLAKVRWWIAQCELADGRLRNRCPICRSDESGK